MVLRAGLAYQALYNTISQSCNISIDLIQCFLLQREGLFSLTFHSHPLHYSSTAAYTASLWTGQELMKLKRNFFFTGYFLFGSSLSCLHSTANCNPTKKGKKIRSREESKDYSFSHHANLTVLICPQAQLPSLGRSSFLASYLAAQLTTGLPSKLFSSVWKQWITFFRMLSKNVPTSKAHRREWQTMLYKL